MNLNNSMLNISGQSLELTESVFEESSLNNVSLNKLDLSEMITNETTEQHTHNLLNDTGPKLSITLNQEERNLRKKIGKSRKDGLLMDITLPTNGTLHTISDDLMGKNSSTTITEVSINLDVVDNEKEESVIPLDEEDDDAEDVSILEKTEETLSYLQSDMFSHLQPNKTSDETEDLQKTVLDHEMVEAELQSSHIVEQESSQFLPTETDLFQYPFIEVGRRLWSSNEQQQHYTKGCLWSPDGTCLLVPVHLDGMHVVELPTDLYTMHELNTDRNINDLASAVHVKEGGTVYDCCWYPYMNSTDPATCCWLATRQHEPIHMWDAFTGELRCSYRGYDDVDEVESAISIVFSNDTQKVIGGYKKTIKIFDTNIPGRDCLTIPVKKAVSCFALTTDNDNCVTAGTWSGYINHYDLRAPKLGALFTLAGHTGGITWLKYSPALDHSWYLFSGARKDNKILQWDMRNYTEPVQTFERNVQTNQRIYYDLSPLHRWLATGDTEGFLRIWNLGDKEQQLELPLHGDCCNGVSFHPSLPIICTTSGQYHFVDVDAEDENLRNVNETEEKIIDYENSLLFLWYGRSVQD